MDVLLNLLLFSSQTGLVMLLQDWSHHYRSFIDVTMNSWIVTVYSSALLEPICPPCYIFSFLFRLLRTWLCMSNLAGVSSKKVRLPFQWTVSMLPDFSWILVIHFSLFLCTLLPCCFVYFMFIAVFYIHIATFWREKYECEITKFNSQRGSSIFLQGEHSISYFFF